jgi:uncharacterized membrane protein YheB (UPF0754 family)
MSAEEKNYGRMIDGELITDELLEKLVREAEEGWDVEELIRKGRAVASPPLGEKARHPRQQH